MNWSSQFSNFSGYYNLNLEMATQPLFDGATEKGMYLRPAQFFSVTKDCPDPEAAAKAISFFINDKGANEILNGERGIPAAKAIREELKGKASDTEKKVYDFMDAVVDYCRDADPAEPSNSRQCVEVLNNNVSEVMYGQMTAQECVDSWMEQSPGNSGKIVGCLTSRMEENTFCPAFFAEKNWRLEYGTCEKEIFDLQSECGRLCVHHAVAGGLFVLHPSAVSDVVRPVIHKL